MKTFQEYLAEEFAVQELNEMTFKAARFMPLSDVKAACLGLNGSDSKYKAYMDSLAKRIVENFLKLEWPGTDIKLKGKFDIAGIHFGGRKGKDNIAVNEVQYEVKIDGKWTNQTSKSKLIWV